jgi:para-aminobenzoate synthetase component 1
VPVAPAIPCVRFARRLRAAPTPLAALRCLAGAGRPFLRLAAGPGFRGIPWSILAVAPDEVLDVARVAPGRPLAAQLAAVAAHPPASSGPPVPFAGGWAGAVGYEARSAVERTPAPRRSPLGFPHVALAHYPAAVVWNHRSKEAFAAGVGTTRRDARAAAADVAHRLERAQRVSPPSPSPPAGPPRPRMDAARFRRAIASARRAVLRGDIFQANVSQRFDARLTGTPLDLFERLVASQPAPYMTYVELGDGRAVLSASPERFLRLRGRTLETDPMKGTRPRGATRAQDRALRQALETSEKDRAELAMIVDLSRNDLGRVCQPGSVRVSVPRRLLRFARVHQSIAVVRGTLARGADRLDALQAAFPPGSVTGAPKVRAMEIIDELEGEGRGPYCGALGWLDDGGDMDLSVGIRTILVSGARATYRVGGAITLGSDPKAEWRETLDKGRGLFAALCGQEDET